MYPLTIGEAAPSTCREEAVEGTRFQATVLLHWLHPLILNCAGASAISGFFAAACSLPFDYVKTQIQKQQPGPDGKLPFAGSLDCAIKTVRQYGPLKLYSGFPTYVVRIAPHVMVSGVLPSFSVRETAGEDVTLDGQQGLFNRRQTQLANINTGALTTGRGAPATHATFACPV